MNDLTIQRKQDADRERVPGAGKGKTSLSLSKSGEGLLVRAVKQRSDEIYILLGESLHGVKVSSGCPRKC